MVEGDGESRQWVNVKRFETAIMKLMRRSVMNVDGGDSPFQLCM